MSEVTDDYARIIRTRNGIGTVVSNFDHVLDSDIENQLKANETTYAKHPALEFHGVVWYENGRCFEAIRRYCVYQCTFEGADVGEVTRLANEEFGFE